MKKNKSNAGHSIQDVSTAKSATISRNSLHQIKGGKDKTKKGKIIIDIIDP